MAIDTEKILKISDKDYFNLTGEDSSDYMLKKIKIDVGRPNYVMATFANNVPSEAEIVVNYKQRYKNPYFICATGTAIIPKAK